MATKTKHGGGLRPRTYDRYKLATLALLCGNALSQRDADRMFRVTRLAVAVHRLRSGYWGTAVPVHTVNVCENSTASPALGMLYIKTAPVTYARYACKATKAQRDAVVAEMFPDVPAPERAELVRLFQRQLVAIPKTSDLVNGGGHGND